MSEPAPDRVDMEKIVSLCRRRGFVFPSSEIYGGLQSCWDYGPLGVELKRNVKEAWWQDMVMKRDDVVGLDTSILMHPRTWEASGHLAGFSDPMVECKNCQHRFRPDQVAAIKAGNPPKYFTAPEVGELALKLGRAGITVSPFNFEETTLQDYLNDISVIPCPFCETVGQFTEPRQFNLMFKTFMGPVEDEASIVYLRPETAQGIFVNFQNVLNTTRKKLPFGIAQMGKSFRNEITTGNFIFRSREFEQMELEYFVKPQTADRWFDSWVAERLDWYQRLGVKPKNLRVRVHAKEELSHYSRATSDIEYYFPMGWSELEGIANRGDFDLAQHSAHSGKSFTYYDEETKEHFLPTIIEPSAGVDRSILAVLCDAYAEEPDKDEVRVVLHLHPRLAPFKVSVLPLSRKEPLVKLAREIHTRLRKLWTTDYDDAQSIGRRYRRQDEIGTPFCVTVDFQSLEDKQVTIRERDTMNQVRIPITGLESTLGAKLGGEAFATQKLWYTTG